VKESIFVTTKTRGREDPAVVSQQPAANPVDQTDFIEVQQEPDANAGKLELRL
jgi:hypothetical protein